MLSLPDYKEKQIIVCFAAEGQRLSVKNDNLIIKDDTDAIVLQCTCHKIFSVWVVGHTTLTTGILERSRKFGFSIFLLAHSHKLMGVWSSPTEGNFLLRQKQYEYKDLTIAQHLVQNKISNQLALLKSIRIKTAECKQAIDKLKEHAAQTLNATDVQTLLGIEGVASRMFFAHWYADMNWQGRKPRTKADILNTVLDIGYTYLFYIVECMLNLYGFDLYQGVYHKCFYQRKSLVCDIVEPFRCIIDQQVKRAYGLKQFQADDFKEEKGQFFLKIDKNKDYTKWLMQAILAHKEAIFSYTQDYYRAFMRNKPTSQYPFFDIKD